MHSMRHLKLFLASPRCIYFKDTYNYPELRIGEYYALLFMIRC